MATKRQIRANRRNARRSTGPKSAAGRAASSANALRHGLSAADTVVLPNEDLEVFERLQQGVFADLEPENTLQAVLAQRIVVLLWRLDRAARLEAELFVHGDLVSHRDKLRAVPGRAAVRVALSRSYEGGEGEGEDGGTLAEAMDTLDEATDAVDNEILMQAPSAKVLVEREASARAFDRLARYEGTLQRALHRTLEEFRRLRDASDASAEAAAPDADPDPAAGPSPGGRTNTQCVADGPADEADTPAGQAEDEGRREDGKGVSQNEANSAQTPEAAPCSPSIAASPEIPPTDPPVF